MTRRVSGQHLKSAMSNLPTDLVMRLRDIAGKYDEWDWHGAIEVEAAAEIERLRRDLEIQTVNATAVLQAQHERDAMLEQLTELRKYSIAACSEMGCFCGDEEGEEKCSMCVLGEVIRAFDESAPDVGDQHGS